MRRRTGLFVSSLSILLIAVVAASAGAALNKQWAEFGTALTTEVHDERNISIVPDGTGGAIFVWERAGDLFAGRADAAGTVLWGVYGEPVSTAANSQVEAAAVTDGAGGAIVAWVDERGTDRDIYAQRLDPQGNALWTTDGVVVCDASANQAQVNMVSDGEGGTYLSWIDDRYGLPLVFVQRIDGNGTPQWAANGINPCSCMDYATEPHLVSDGAGGAIVTYGDPVHSAIVVQRFLPDGSRPWGGAGVSMAMVPFNPAVTADGTGGVVVANAHGNGLAGDIYVQRVDASGSVMWTPGGVALCTAPASQNYPAVVSDGTGGAIVVWEDQRDEPGPPTTYKNIYGQRVDNTGAPQWTADGIAIVAQQYDQERIQVIEGPGSTVFLTWRDERSGYNDLKAYVQQLDFDGSLVMPDGGLRVSPVGNDQMQPRIASDGMGGAVVGWEDDRASSLNIYGQRIAGVATGVDDPVGTPEMRVRPNVPNPFRTTTTISFAPTQGGDASFAVFDAAGRRVYHRSLGTVGPQWQSIRFDGRSTLGQPLAAGVYFYRVTAGGESATRKLVITR